MKILKLLSIITLIMLLQSCSKDPKDGCDAPKDKYYNLTSAQLNQSPYFTNPAFDTISFASDKGETLTFVKTKTDTTWYNETGQGNPDCGYGQNYFQTIHNTYITIKGNGSFEVSHYKKNGGINDIVYVKFNKNNLSFGGDQIGYTGYWTFKKVVSISNKSFNDAIIIYPNNYDSLVGEGFINKDFGLFCYKDKSSDVNYLISR